MIAEIIAAVSLTILITQFITTQLIYRNMRRDYEQKLRDAGICPECYRPMEGGNKIVVGQMPPQPPDKREKMGFRKSCGDN